MAAILLWRPEGLFRRGERDTRQARSLAAAVRAARAASRVPVARRATFYAELVTKVMILAIFA